MNRRPFTTALFALTAIAVLAVAPAQASTPNRAAQGEAELHHAIARVRAATARYHDLAAAEADGYVLSSPCVPQMGFHYQRGVADGVEHLLDPLQPEILVYAPHANGDLKLVAVEYASWAPAELFGQPFAPPAEAGQGPPFHTLHAWVWKHNPDGLFAARNPKVSCPS